MGEIFQTQYESKQLSPQKNISQGDIENALLFIACLYGISRIGPTGLEMGSDQPNIGAVSAPGYADEAISVAVDPPSDLLLGMD